MRRGDRFTLGGDVYRVAYVNECRAHCVTVRRETRTIGDRTFTARRKAYIDIAPGTDLATVSDVLGAKERGDS